MPNSIRLVIFVMLSLCLIACNTQEVYMPKPKGFNRMDLPKQAYLKLTEPHPYSFEYSENAVIEPDTFGKAEPHWIIVHYPELKSRIQFTYKPLKGNLDRLTKHIDDAYKLAAKHHVKATSQKERVVELKSGKRAVLIDIEGEVPSHFQFYITDTSQHYLRGAVYLMEPSLNDSLSPLINYLKEDCMHILETLTWSK
ncbi:MAG: gliding motility-associated lipoprotein GldD [Algoriphagus sp.]|jgi:gliding motility-associated lipoprotein GldD